MQSSNITSNPSETPKRGRTSERKPSFRSDRKPSMIKRMSDNIDPPSRASTFGSEDNDINSRKSTASSVRSWSPTAAQAKATKSKTKKPKVQSQTFSDVGRHSNQWLFNDMSITDAVKTLFGKK